LNKIIGRSYSRKNVDQSYVSFFCWVCNTQEDEEDELGVQDSGYLFRLDPEEMLVEVYMSDFSVSLQLRSGKRGKSMNV